MKHYEEPIIEIMSLKVEDILSLNDFTGSGLIGGDNELEEDEG
jgi:hypothetical protein